MGNKKEERNQTGNGIKEKKEGKTVHCTMFIEQCKVYIVQCTWVCYNRAFLTKINVCPIFAVGWTPPLTVAPTSPSR